MATGPQRLKKLAPRHKHAVSLRIGGDTNRQIAAKLDCAKVVVDRWFQDPLVKDELERQSDRLTQTILDRRAEVAVRALDAMALRIQAPAENQRNTDEGLDETPISDAARLRLIERALELEDDTKSAPEGGPAAIGPGPGGSTNVLALMSSLSPEQIREAGRLAAKELADKGIINGKAELNK